MDLSLGKSDPQTTNYFLLEQPFTYALSDDPLDDNDNQHFKILGNRLYSKHPLDFETKSKYTINIITKDLGNLSKSYEKTFRLNVLDGADAPTDILLSNNVISENLKKGSIIGELSVLDSDADEKHTFKLVNSTDENPNDNTRFKISKGNLVTNAILDFEEIPNHVIRIQVTDKDKLNYQEEFIINVANVNDDPSGISITNNEILENQAKGTLVGTLSALDQDLNDSHTLQIVGGAERTLYKLEGQDLVTNEAFNFEEDQKHEIVVRVTDSWNGSVDVPLVIYVLNANEAPSDISLSSTSVQEGNADFQVGTLDVSDEDIEDTYTYTLENGSGDDHNHLFIIDGNNLKTITEVHSGPLSIRIKVSDIGGNAFGKEFSFQPDPKMKSQHHQTCATCGH